MLVCNKLGPDLKKGGRDCTCSSSLELQVQSRPPFLRSGPSTSRYMLGPDLKKGGRDYACTYNMLGPDFKKGGRDYACTCWGQASRKGAGLYVYF